MFSIFRRKEYRNGTAQLAKTRLNNVLMCERYQNIGYLDNLKSDITELMRSYAKTQDIVVNAMATTNDTLDIKISIGKAE